MAENIEDPSYVSEIPIDDSDIDPEAQAAYEAAVQAAQAAGIDTQVGSPAQLRDALARAKGETAESQTEIIRLQEQATLNAFDRLGLDPERGVGKAVAQTYEGDLGGLAAYVEAEYDWIGPANPMAGQIASEQARLDAASQGAGSIPVRTPAGDIGLAEAEGRFGDAMALKGQRMAEWFEPNG